MLEALPGFLDAHASQQHPCHLSRIHWQYKFFPYKKGCMGEPDSVISHVDLSAYERNYVARGVPRETGRWACCIRRCIVL